MEQGTKFYYRRSYWEATRTSDTTVGGLSLNPHTLRPSGAPDVIRDILVADCEPVAKVLFKVGDDVKSNLRGKLSLHGTVAYIADDNTVYVRPMISSGRSVYGYRPQELQHIQKKVTHINLVGHDVSEDDIMELLEIAQILGFKGEAK